MDGRRNGLGLVAIGLGALALVVALIGQIGPRVSIQMDGDERQPQLQQRGSPADVAPTAVPHDRDAVPFQGGGRFERDERFGPHGHGGWGGPPWADHGERGRHGFFPFMILGSIFKFLAAMALIFFGLRLFRGGRGGRGGRGRGYVHEPQPGDHRRSPVHTSETSYL